MAPPEYIDCVLTIYAYDRATFEFLDRSYSGKPNLAPASLKPLLDTAGFDVRLYGKTLFDALFPPGDDLAAGYRLALALARLRSQRLRLRLRVDANAPIDLHGHNWELLYDEKERAALGRAPETAFSRLPQLDREQKPAVSVRPKLLVIVSSPKDAERLGLDVIDAPAVRREVEESLEPLAGVLDYEFLDGPATLVRIREKLAAGFHALHVQAHGMIRDDRVRARLVLETEGGQADPVDERFFADLFAGLQDLRLVTLIACHSGAQTGDDPFGGLALALVQQNFPAVVAMQQPITFEAAKIFNKYFYAELARYGVVDAAVNEARLYVHLASGNEEGEDWSAPVLFSRLKDGRVWSSAAAAAAPAVEAVAADEDQPLWAPLVEALRQGNLVPIIGPEINQGLLPSNAEIAALWAQEFKYQKYNYPGNNRNDLPRVARFVEAINESGKFPHRRLLTLYKEELLERVKQDERAQFKNTPLPDVITKLAPDYFEADPESPHRVLADLKNVSTYLTTTPDNFMAEALKYRGRQPKRAAVLWQEGDREPKPEAYDTLEGDPENPLVWHFYGVAARPVSLALTEDDHLDFLRFLSKDSWRLPSTLRETLTEATLLFLGFNMRDLDFRVFFKGVVSQLQARSGRIAVLQVQPEKSYEEKLEDLQLVKNFLENDSSDLQIKIRWVKVRDFLVQLRARG
ncbi:MAG TPA: CHAT domain-containing protein [Pyrinomonadaceae bacterium]|jgi:hypothetical protein